MRSPRRRNSQDDEALLRRRITTDPQDLDARIRLYAALRRRGVAPEAGLLADLRYFAEEGDEGQVADLVRSIRPYAREGDKKAAELLALTVERLGDRYPFPVSPADPIGLEWKDVFIAWDELVEVLGLEKILIYFDGQEMKTPWWVWDSAAEQFDAWKKEHGYHEEEIDDPESEDSKPLTESQVQEVRGLFSGAIETQMLPWVALRDRPAERAIEVVNQGAARSRQVYTHERELPDGVAVEKVTVTSPDTNPGAPIETLGYTFRIRPPFIRSYVEGAEWAGYGDENMTLADIKDGEAVFRVAKWHWDARGEGPSSRDPAGFWLGKNWDPVTDAEAVSEDEILKAIEENAPKKNPSR